MEPLLAVAWTSPTRPGAASGVGVGVGLGVGLGVGARRHGERAGHLRERVGHRVPRVGRVPEHHVVPVEGLAARARGHVVRQRVQALEPGLQLAAPVGIEPHADGQEGERGPVAEQSLRLGEHGGGGRARDVVLAVGEEHDGRSRRVRRQIGRGLLHRLHVVRVAADLADDGRIGAPAVLPGREAEAVRELLDRGRIRVEREVLAPGKAGGSTGERDERDDGVPVHEVVAGHLDPVGDVVERVRELRAIGLVAQDGAREVERDDDVRRLRRIRGDRGGDADGHDDDGHRAPDRAQQRAAQAGIGC